ncbi:calcium-binding protein, putative [Entamoeba nuttalli P19]|uniref:Calcium-binding protein, putative n=2 Tax=Entamoeba nuttalli TaxID=412467 RepID=K2H617_ENTNP|nr:calcium-binding protein, putative [Entamoeba nuttalli P19]EKE37944.1 calcium-binding protein, putative [Entamoeba nuttalli P19]|eukprot:XP_008859719.1 calcium-binding protein, putative [Entamoeba nuttalli P19]
MSEERYDEIQLALQHIEVNWNEMGQRIQSFNSYIEQANSTKEFKKIAGEASDLIGDLDESEKLRTFISMTKIDIELTILEAKNLAVSDLKRSDPYVVFMANKEKYKTKVIENVLDPVWNESFQIKVEVGEKLMLQIMDKDVGKKDDENGVCYWKIPSMYSGQIIYDILEIDKKGFLYIKAVCNNSPLQKRLMPFDYEKITLLEVCIISVNGFYNSLISNTCIKDITKPKVLKHLKYTMELTTSKTKCQRLIKKKTVEGQQYGNYVFFDQKIFVKGTVNDEIKISFLAKEKHQKKFKVITNSSFIIPDFLPNEIMTLPIPLSESGSLQLKITCLESVYTNVYPTVIPTADMVIEKKGNVVMKLTKSNGFGDFLAPYATVQFGPLLITTSPIQHSGEPVIFNESFLALVETGTKAIVRMYNKDMKNPSKEGKKLCEGKFEVPEIKNKPVKVVVRFNSISQLEIEFFLIRTTSSVFDELEKTNRIEKRNQKIESIFNRFDEDKDGYLKVREFRTAIQFVNSTLTRSLSVFLFPCFAVNNQINLTIFKEVTEVLASFNNSHEAITKYIYNFIDQNKIGSITLTQFINFAHQTQIADNDKDLTNLFNSFDYDKSKTLSYKEFYRMIQCVVID